MNQDQVKSILLKLDDKAEPFTLLFSGKESKKVHGLYHPDKQEIIIHNRNFQNDGALLYTAIHEFAHHLHFTRSHRPVGSRAHTSAFRRIFHRLLSSAEEMSLMESRWDTHDDLSLLTRQIRMEFMREQGKIAKGFGEALIKAETLCKKYELRFEDYLERILQLDKSTAKVIMRIPQLETPPELGYENMKLIASQKKPEERLALETRLQAGESRDCARKPEEEEIIETVSHKERLIREKQRIESTIHNLETKLSALNSRIDEIETTEK